MNLFIWAGLVLCWTVVMANDQAGILQRIRKSVVIGDMNYILQTIFGNVKFYTFKDISETQFAGASNKGLFMHNIEIVEVNFDITPTNYKLGISSSSSDIEITATQSVLKYVLKFDWKAESMGMRVLYGTGYGFFKAKDLKAAYNPVKHSSSIDATWESTLLNITGLGLFDSGVKAWVTDKLTNKIPPEITKAINNNKAFLHEYMHHQTKQIKRKLNEKYILEYNSQVFKVEEDSDFLVYSHNVSLAFNGYLRYILTKGIQLPANKQDHDVSIYVAPQYVPLTVSAHGSVGKCDEDFNLNSLGLTGKVKDLFEVLPELFSKYDEEEKLRMHCEYAHDGVIEGENNLLTIPTRCSFIVGETTVLSSKAFLNMTYSPTAQKNFFAVSMKNIVAVKSTSKPQTLNINIFLTNLYNQLGQKKFGSAILEVPMIRYVPYRDAPKVKIDIADGIYVSHYDYK